MWGIFAFALALGYAANAQAQTTPRIGFDPLSSTVTPTSVALTWPASDQGIRWVWRTRLASLSDTCPTTSTTTIERFFSSSTGYTQITSAQFATVNLQTGTTAYTDTTVQPGIYCYVVAQAAGYARSNPLRVTVPNAEKLTVTHTLRLHNEPRNPAHLTNPNGGYIALSWTGGPPGAHYKILSYASAARDGEIDLYSFGTGLHASPFRTPEDIGNPSGPERAESFERQNFGNTAYFLVRHPALSLESDLITIPIPYPPPLPPGMPTISSVGFNSAEVAWTAPTLRTGHPVVTAYRLERAIAGSGVWTHIPGVTGTTLAYSDTGLTPETDYRYRVRAVNSRGDSQWSAAGSATTPRALPTAVAAANPAMMVAEGTRVELSAAGSSANMGTDDSIDGYQWMQVAADNRESELPASHANYVTLSGAKTDTATFIVPESFVAGMPTLQFRLRVEDADGEHDDYVTVGINAVDNPPQVTARASTQTANAGALVTLIGGVSADVDTPAGSSTAYAWDCPVTAPTGATFTVPTLNIAATQTATFTAPSLTDAAGNSVTQLTVTCTLTADNGAMGTAEAVVITILPNPAGEVVDKAVLPEVLRNVPTSINRSIFQRIQERQRADGQWK